MAKSPITIPFSTDGVEVALKDGVSLPANARGFVGVGFDGTTTKFILVDAGGRQFAAVTSLAETGWSPDPSVRQEGTDQVYTDVSGNLRVRAQVLTDEASFRDDFGGSSVTPTGTGTISVTNGDPAVTGTGTAFTTELVVGHYIRLSAHANSVLTRIASIESDTALTLEEGYLGANGSGAFVYSNWVVATSTGGSISVASSTVTITNGTGIGNVTAISRAGDYLPFSVLFEARVSQRIANQTTILGLADDVTGNPVVYAVFEFVGTDNTIIRCKSAFDSDSIETTDVKLPSGLTSDAVGLHFEISVMSDEVLFVVNDKLVAKHKSHIPGPYTPLVLGAVVINTAAVGSNTSLYLDHVFFKNHDQLTVDAIGDNKPIPIQGVTGGVPVQTESSPREEPTFVAVASNVAVGNNKSLISVYNPSASTKTLRIREVRLGNSKTTAVTGVVGLIGIRRFVMAIAPTGGASVTITSHDTSNVLGAGVEARTGATISGEGSSFHSGRFSTDEWGPGTLDVEGHQQSFMNYFPLYRKEDPQEQPIVLRPGEGLTVKFETNSTAGAFDVLVRFSQV